MLRPANKLPLSETVGVDLNVLPRLRQFVVDIEKQMDIDYGFHKHEADNKSGYRSRL